MKHSPCEQPRASRAEAAAPDVLEESFLLDDTTLFNLEPAFDLDIPTQEELESLDTLVDGLVFFLGGSDVCLGGNGGRTMTSAPACSKTTSPPTYCTPSMRTSRFHCRRTPRSYRRRLIFRTTSGP